MRHLDLFSGIGGFAYAAQQVWGDGHEIVAFCEMDKFCQKVLKMHWPDTEIIDDVRDERIKKYKNIDLLTGGFPCQPFSVAGKRKGTDDDRFLWPETFEIIKFTKPTVFIGENVTGIKSMALEQKDIKVESRTIARNSESDLYEAVYSRIEILLLDSICEELEKEGYEVQSIIIPACAVNAPHERARTWIVAVAKELYDRGHSGEQEKRQVQQFGNSIEQGIIADSYFTNGFGWGGKSGSNKNRLQKNEQTGYSSRSEPSRCNENAPDTNNPSTSRQRRNSRKILRFAESERFDVCSWERNWLEVATRLCRVDDGISNRVDRLKALGNAIVPQVAMVIMQAIKEVNYLCKSA